MPLLCLENSLQLTEAALYLQTNSDCSFGEASTFLAGNNQLLESLSDICLHSGFIILLWLITTQKLAKKERIFTDLRNKLSAHSKTNNKTLNPCAHCKKVKDQLGSGSAFSCQHLAEGEKIGRKQTVKEFNPPAAILHMPRNVRTLRAVVNEDLFMKETC